MGECVTLAVDSRVWILINVDLMLSRAYPAPALLLLHPKLVCSEQNPTQGALSGQGLEGVGGWLARECARTHGGEKKGTGLVTMRIVQSVVARDLLSA